MFFSKLSELAIINIRRHHLALFENLIVKEAREIAENEFQSIPTHSWPLQGVVGLQLSPPLSFIISEVYEQWSSLSNIFYKLLSFTFVVGGQVVEYPG